MKILIVDGYIDEPGCLGVPPFLAPLPRYIFGSLKKVNAQAQIQYYTVDQLRSFIFKSDDGKRYLNLPDQQIPENYEIIFFITGVSVPGKYLGGTPIKSSELKRYSKFFPDSFKILCGPATQFGIGEEGGKPSVPVIQLEPFFNLILFGDAEIIIPKIFTPQIEFKQNLSIQEIETFSHLNRISMGEINEISLIGAEIIKQHPNFKNMPEGNLICEIETFRGCPRYKTGGCAFCTEPMKGKTVHRDVQNVIDEIYSLYSQGVLHFRIGSQTDFYAYQHGNFDKERYPRPNPAKIEELLSGIWRKCPNIKTLHIDNVNALNFVLYPEEAHQITELIIKYCTPGNIAAIGVESIDPIVIQQNNLKASKKEIQLAVEMINAKGKTRGKNGAPTYLPGLNFIMGLPGETKSSLDQNYQFLKELLKDDLWLRRINLRKLLISSSDTRMPKGARKKLQKNQKLYYSWKKLIREEIDFPYLQKLFPIGTLLNEVYAEKNEGNGTYLRQIGTYPILCFVPRELTLHQFYNLRVIDYGFRSLVCLVDPISFSELSLKELASIKGIGKKRASTILQNNPQTESDWLKILPTDVYEQILKLKSKKDQ